MKKTILITILALLGITQAVAAWDSSDYLPIVREGVKWVNEKVIINQGDTTNYYYIYEFSGDDPLINESGEINNACFYSQASEIDASLDSLIAGMRDDYGEVTFVRNNAYNALYREDMINLELNEDKEFRLMFPLAGYMNGTTVIYNFSDPSWNCVGYYLSVQHAFHNLYGYEEVLTEENFTEVEPIEIEGISCSRYAYVKENGDTMCYVVEGIGFDSRNMGDLLTPFTREPDPDADYQEYWGLSHVVKDGKIIYKGMRYNPALFENPGDVNGDGEINIADANSVIDIVILGGNAGHTRAPAADANHDGEVNIGDINYIINFILNGE